MRREKLKTALLLVLILSSVILAANVWFGSGVWPHGYDFFVTLPDRAFFSQFFAKNQPYLTPMESLAKPRLLVVTNGESRGVYYNSDVSYRPYYESVNTFFKAVLADESALMMSTIVGEEEWYDVLRNDELLDTRSIYIAYSTAFSPRLFAQVIGTEHTWLSDKVSTLQEFILAPVDASGEDVLLYIRNPEDNTISKFYIRYPKKGELYGRISEMDENLGYSYAFELNLHDSNVGIGGGVEQKVVMDPLLLISPFSTESVAITGTNPVASEGDMDALLSAFDYRERGINRYTGTDGTLHIVENYGSISIHPDGLVEYYAVDEEKGVNILPSEGGTASLYDALNGAVRFADRVWTSLVPDQPFDALVSSDLVENAQGEYTFTLDYYYEGTPITIDADGINHAAIIRVKNGRIVEYRHFLRRFAGTGTSMENVPMLEAIDSMYARFAGEDSQIRITDLYLTYIANTSSGETRPVWCGRIAGQEELVIVH